MAIPLISGTLSLEGIESVSEERKEQRTWYTHMGRDAQSHTYHWCAFGRKCLKTHPWFVVEDRLRHQILWSVLEEGTGRRRLLKQSEYHTAGDSENAQHKLVKHTHTHIYMWGRTVLLKRSIASGGASGNSESESNISWRCEKNSEKFAYERVNQSTNQPQKEREREKEREKDRQTDKERERERACVWKKERKKKIVSPHKIFILTSSSESDTSITVP